MSKKEILSKLLYATGIDRVSRYGRRFFSRDLKVLAYHRICDTDELNDPELVSASCSDFEWQVAHVRQHYHPMTFEDVLKHLSKGQKLPRNAVIITFDDGFADNYFNAYEILRKQEVPATFYIATDYIDSDRTFWFNELSRVIMGTRTKTLELENNTYPVGESREERLLLLENMLQMCKRVPDIRRHEYLESINGQLNDAAGCDQLARPLTWDEVVEMSRGGMEIGSHSCSHPVLSRLDSFALKREINESKDRIEEKLDKPVLTLSYPDGGSDAVSPEVLDEVKNAGYLLGVSYISGNNRGFNVGELMLRRLHVERYTTRTMFTSMLALPEIFG